MSYNERVWLVQTTREFDDWFVALGEAEQVEIAAKVELLKIVGPQLGRPHVDTLNGSRHSNMKELRARTPGAVIRVAFAFDPVQNAILLIGGDKSGVSQARFYRRLIAKADQLYDRHLEQIRRSGRGPQAKESGNG